MATSTYGWAHQLTNTSGYTYEFDYGENLVTDAKGNVYYATKVTVNNVRSFIVHKFSKNGVLLWSTHLNKTTGFGNGLSNSYPYSWFMAVGPQGLVLVAGQGYGTNTPSTFNKVICLDSKTGALRWAKAVSPSPPDVNEYDFYYIDRYQFSAVHANHKTGHTYLVSLASRSSKFNITTLDSNGNVSGSIDCGIPANSIIHLTGGQSNLNGSMIFVGSYVNGYIGTGGMYIILSAEGAVTTPMRLIGANTTFLFSAHPLGRLRANGNLMWTAENGLIEFSSDMSTVLSYQGIPDIIDISERLDGSFAIVCSASLKILNKDKTELISLKDIDVGNNRYVLQRLNGASSLIDRYSFVPSGSHTIVSVDPAVHYWRQLISPGKYVTVLDTATNIPRSVSSLTAPTITDPNLSYGTSPYTVLSSDYSSSVNLLSFSEADTFISVGEPPKDYTYPTLAPTDRTFVLGTYPTKIPQTCHGISQPRLYGSVGSYAQLALSYPNISDATALTFFDSYNSSLGGYLETVLPPEVVAGISDADLAARITDITSLTWHWMEPPVRKPSIAGFSNVQVVLVAYLASIETL